MRLLFGLLSLSFGKEGCYTKEENKPIRCSPQFQNIAFDRKVIFCNMTTFFARKELNFHARFYTDIKIIFIIKIYINYFL